MILQPTSIISPHSEEVDCCQLQNKCKDEMTKNYHNAKHGGHAKYLRDQEINCQYSISNVQTT